jgi:hypothetical protein
VASLNSCYLYSSTKKTWSAASSHCLANSNGWLVTVNSQAENDYVSTFQTNGNEVWIGFSDLKIEGTFVWVNNAEKSTYTSWLPGNPDNWNNIEDCAEAGYLTVGKWNDEDCNALDSFICEVSPLRSSTCLACSSGIYTYIL